MKLLSVAEMQQVEQEADASGLSYSQMMANAGRGVAEVVLSEYGSLEDKSAVALVGSGNNGGDALVALTSLIEAGWHTTAYLVRPRPAKDLVLEQFKKAGGEVSSAASDEEFGQLGALLTSHRVLLDGILGTGIRLPLKEEIASVLRFAGERIKQMPVPPHLIAVDCPSGVDCDSGEADQECLPAEITVTMAAAKQGLLRFPAADLIGRLRLASIGTLDELPAWQAANRFVVEEDWIRQRLPQRPRTAHKGTFGTALVVAGSINFIGAAWLAGQAAYRSGAGLVTLAVPNPLHTILAGQFPEATWLVLPDRMGVIAQGAEKIIQTNLTRVTALLIGPGFGQDDSTLAFMDRLFASDASYKTAAIGFIRPEKGNRKEEKPILPPLVVDADGLKLLSRLPDWPSRLPKMAVLTPHPGEMAVLTGLKVEELMADRIASAERFARQWGHVVVLKGAFTVIASPDGPTAVIPVASAALARAGTGDVLAGLISGLRAQGMEGFEAATAGAWIHAQAGLKAVQNVGSMASVLASDVLKAIPEVIG